MHKARKRRILKRRVISAKRRKNSDMPESVSDIGTLERWKQRIDLSCDGDPAGAAAAVRCETVLQIRDRRISTGGRVIETGAFDTAEHVLDVMLRRGMLGDTRTEEGARLADWRLTAGMRLRGLYCDAGLEKSGTMQLNLAGGGGNSHYEETDEEAEARMRFNRTLGALTMLGADSDLVFTVCCAGIGIPAGSSAGTLALQRRLLPRLVMALDILARIFRISETGERRRPAIRGGPL